MITHLLEAFSFQESRSNVGKSSLINSLLHRTALISAAEAYWDPTAGKCLQICLHRLWRRSQTCRVRRPLPSSTWWVGWRLAELLLWDLKANFHAKELTSQFVSRSLNICRPCASGLRTQFHFYTINEKNAAFPQMTLVDVPWIQEGLQTQRSELKPLQVPGLGEAMADQSQIRHWENQRWIHWRNGSKTCLK